MRSHNESENFDVRSVNIVKINTVVDCEIIIAECDYSLSLVDAKLARAEGIDEAWVDSLRKVRDHLSHKRTLAEMKHKSLVSKAGVPSSPEGRFKTLFQQEAKALLPPETYDAIFSAAGIKNGLEREAASGAAQ